MPTLGVAKEGRDRASLSIRLRAGSGQSLHSLFLAFRLRVSHALDRVTFPASRRRTHAGFAHCALPSASLQGVMGAIVMERFQR
jgi:hypothetical protein